LEPDNRHRYVGVEVELGELPVSLSGDPQHLDQPAAAVFIMGALHIATQQRTGQQNLHVRQLPHSWRFHSPVTAWT
jgi:hypothetical protein